MNTEDIERATMPFIVVNFSPRWFTASQSRLVCLHYILHVYMTYLYYIGTGVLYHASSIKNSK